MIIESVMVEYFVPKLCLFPCLECCFVDESTSVRNKILKSLLCWLIILPLLAFFVNLEA